MDLKRSSEVLGPGNGFTSQIGTQGCFGTPFWCLQAPLESIKGVDVRLLLVVDQTLEKKVGTDWEAEAVLVKTLGLERAHWCLR